MGAALRTAPVHTSRRSYRNAALCAGRAPRQKRNLLPLGVVAFAAAMSSSAPHAAPPKVPHIFAQARSLTDRNRILKESIQKQHEKLQHRLLEHVKTIFDDKTYYDGVST